MPGGLVSRTGARSLSTDETIISTIRSVARSWDVENCYRVAHRISLLSNPPQHYCFQNMTSRTLNPSILIRHDFLSLAGAERDCGDGFPCSGRPRTNLVAISNSRHRTSYLTNKDLTRTGQRYRIPLCGGECELSKSSPYIHSRFFEASLTLTLTLTLPNHGVDGEISEPAATSPRHGLRALVRSLADAARVQRVASDRAVRLRLDMC